MLDVEHNDKGVLDVDHKGMLGEVIRVWDHDSLKVC